MTQEVPFSSQNLTRRLGTNIQSHGTAWEPSGPPTRLRSGQLRSSVVRVFSNHAITADPGKRKRRKRKKKKNISSKMIKFVQNSVHVRPILGAGAGNTSRRPPPSRNRHRNPDSGTPEERPRCLGPDTPPSAPSVCAPPIVCVGDGEPLPNSPNTHAPITHLGGANAFNVKGPL